MARHRHDGSRCAIFLLRSLQGRWVRSPGQPSVWIISGPSDVGKGTVCTRLRELRPGIHIPASLTTRQSRSGEINGISYHFVPEHRFQGMTAPGQLLKRAIVHGRCSYGTLRRDVADTVAAGRGVLPETGIQGARQVKRNLLKAKLVFIVPPSWEELIKHLERQGTGNASQVERRLTTARVELKAQEEVDFVVVNDRIEGTTQVLVVLVGL